MTILSRKNISAFLLITFILLSVSPLFIYAADPNYTLLTPLPSTDGSDPYLGDSTNNKTIVDTTNPIAYISTLYKIGIGLAVVLAVFMIVYGGVVTMSTDSIENKKEGKEIVRRTLVGLLLLVISYLILYTINPNLLDLGAVFTKNQPGAPAATTP